MKNDLGFENLDNIDEKDEIDEEFLLMKTKEIQKKSKKEEKKEKLKFDQILKNNPHKISGEKLNPNSNLTSANVLNR